VRFPLRWRILLFTVLPPVILTAAALWTVNRSVTREVNASIREGLWRSSRVLEHLLAARSERLAVAVQVIVRDPRFFSALTLPGSSRDPHLRATVKAVARDFNGITRADLFEVFDRSGNLLASVGRSTSTPAMCQPLVREALQRKSVSTLLPERDAHYQVTIAPVIVDGRVVGTLLLGARIGKPLAKDLQNLTRSRVTFLSGNVVTGSTIESPGDREELLGALERLGPRLTRDIAEIEERSQILLTLARHIPGSNPADRQLYVMQRSLSAETAYLNDIQSGLVKLGGLTAIVALLAGLMISERVTRPVQRLVRGAEEMKRGNYEYPLRVRSRDEIGYLAERFGEMREHERVYVNSLKEVARLKSDFISIASHELRTPISVIKGYHELFMQESLGPVTPPQRNALQAIEQSLAGLNRIAEDAAWMAQMEGERPILHEAEYEVAALVEQAVAVARADAPSRNVSVTHGVEPDLQPVTVDGPRLAHAVANLVRNGIRFTPDGGKVTVSARREGDELVVDVRDNGIGLTDEEQELIFSRPIMVREARNHHSSSTLEFNSAGLGLGLSIARGIVEAHGGRIGVESKPGKGSAFVIRVPWRRAEGMSEAA
jgi:signal transduction histidine kinase